MKIHFFIEDTHLPQRFPNASAVTWSLVLQTRNLKTHIYPKDFQMHQQSLDHSSCKRETSLTKLKNSKSVMILVARLSSSPISKMITLGADDELRDYDVKPDTGNMIAMYSFFKIILRWNQMFMLPVCTRHTHMYFIRGSSESSMGPWQPIALVL
jgi:hypothetical protein